MRNSTFQNRLFSSHNLSTKPGQLQYESFDISLFGIGPSVPSGSLQGVGNGIEGIAFGVEKYRRLGNEMLRKGIKLNR